MGQHFYASIDDILKDNGVTSFKETSDGLVAIHKRNTVGGYYWKYYRFYENIAGVRNAGYYYTGSTCKLEA